MNQRKLISYNSPTYFPENIICEKQNAKWLCHIGIHNSANKNAGDTLLFPVVRRAFDLVLGPFNWQLKQAWEEFNAETAERVNASCHAIILGGGGLLLKDQVGCENSNSGWQWNSSINAIQRLKIPLIIFAIGYNRFPGQPDFDEIFRHHIQSVVTQADFFGLRNTGSIRAVNEYIPNNLTHKLRHQYCPTTVIWQLYPEYRKKAEQHDRENKKVFVINAAFDRTNFRFGKEINLILNNIANAIAIVEKRGWEILVVAHKVQDRKIEPYLNTKCIRYNTVDLTEANPEQIIDFYTTVDLVLGMRGHAQMIPFGLRRPIISLISHDKMRFFLEDIGYLNWGIYINDSNLITRLETMLDRIEYNRNEVYEEIAQAQMLVWEETLTNLATIGNQVLGINPNL